jgi:hypothetical protein
MSLRFARFAPLVALLLLIPLPGPSLAENLPMASAEGSDTITTNGSWETVASVSVDVGSGADVMVTGSFTYARAANPRGTACFRLTNGTVSSPEVCRFVAYTTADMGSVVYLFENQLKTAGTDPVYTLQHRADNSSVITTAGSISAVALLAGSYPLEGSLGVVSSFDANASLYTYQPIGTGVSGSQISAPTPYLVMASLWATGGGTPTWKLQYCQGVVCSDIGTEAPVTFYQSGNWATQDAEKLVSLAAAVRIDPLGTPFSPTFRVLVRPDSGAFPVSTLNLTLVAVNLSYGPGGSSSFTLLGGEALPLCGVRGSSSLTPCLCPESVEGVPGYVRQNCLDDVADGANSPGYRSTPPTGGMHRLDSSPGWDVDILLVGQYKETSNANRATTVDFLVTHSLSNPYGESPDSDRDGNTEEAHASSLDLARHYSWPGTSRLDSGGSALASVASLSAVPTRYTYKSFLRRRDPQTAAGPLAVTYGIVSSSDYNVTRAVVSGFGAQRGPAGVRAFWETASETRTSGFNLLRVEPDGGWTKVNPALLAAVPPAPQGGRYEVWDPDAPRSGHLAYLVEEVELDGTRRHYGPFPGGEGSLEAPPLPTPAGARGTRPVRPPSESSRRRLEQRSSARKAATDGVAGESCLMETSREGLHGVEVKAVAPLLGLSVRSASSRLMRGLLSLTNRGSQVPYHFDGTRLIFWAPPPPSPHERHNVFRLAPGAGRRLLPSGRPPPPPGGTAGSFSEILSQEEDRLPAYSLTLPPWSDCWFWDYFVAGDAVEGTRSYTFRTPHRTAGSGKAWLTVHFQGASDAAHRARLRLNGTYLGEATGSGTGAWSARLPFSRRLLRQGNNTLEIQAALEAETDFGLFYLDDFHLEYAREYHAQGDVLLAVGGRGPAVTVHGFSSPDILALDVTDPGDPLLLRPPTVARRSEGYAATFPQSTPGGTYAVAARGALLSPASLSPSPPTTLDAADNAADYLVILPAGFEPAVRPLVEHRRAQGLTARVVTLEEVSDRFGDGFRDPAAVRSFLRHARTTWRVPPTYVLLVGRGTFDGRDLMGAGDNLLPALLAETPDGSFNADGLFGDTDADGVPEMAVGRLPVLTPGELSLLAEKIIAYESSGGTWRNRVLLAADRTSREADFTRGSRMVAERVGPGYHGEDVSLEEDPGARARLLAAIADGVFLLNYLGHGGLDRLAAEGLLTSSDIPSLDNAGRPFLLAAVTCVAGYSSIPGHPCLAEELVLDPGGGAIAAVAPSGLSIHREALDLDGHLMDNVTGGTYRRLGDAWVAALERYEGGGGPSWLSLLYNLLGDPALVIR